MKYQEEAKRIVELVGGEANVNSLVHCATRLRFELKDDGKANKEALSKLPYVLQVVISGGQYQVVIGPAVSDYFKAILETTGINRNSSEDSGPDAKGKKMKPMDRVMKVISGAFSPLIPLLAGAGMVKALLTVFIEIGLMGYEDSTYLILSAAGNAVFYFLPIFLGITLSKQFGANAYVGGAIGAALLEPNFTGLLAAEGGVSFLGIAVTPIDYAATIFPIFIATIIYSLLDKALKKIIKKELQLFLVSMLCLMIMVPFTAIIFGPFGTKVGDVVSQIVVKLFEFNSIIAGLILGAAYPFLTLLGLHWGFTPITLQNLNDFGGDVIEGVCVCAVFAEIGIAIGAYLKGRKHSRIREIAGPTILTGVFAGVTEPILYGIIMNYKRLLVVVAIASGVGGAVNGAFHVTCDAYVFHNIFSLAMQTYSPFVPYLLGIFVALVVGAVLTYFWGIRPEDMEDFMPELGTKANGSMNTTENIGAVTDAQESNEKKAIQANEAGEKSVVIEAPMSGRVVPLKDVPDEVFASEVAGKGIAIEPEGNEVSAPCDGTVTLVFPSKHAIGITTPEGLELLIHVGLNTVMLDGEGFRCLIKQGDTVTAGQKLLEFDREFIQSKGCSLISPVLVTNAEQTACMNIGEKKRVEAGEEIYQVIL